MKFFSPLKVPLTKHCLIGFCCNFVGFFFTAIGGGVIILGYLQVSMWMMASERQTHRIRKLFYRNILRQNIGWFDTQESGELNTRISG